MEQVETIVVGAGAVGLAIAAALAEGRREVMVLERETDYGLGISSRNSEVIHAGIYYPPGSLKARLCVAGRTLLYNYCEARGVPVRRTGKLIVATGAEERERLLALQRQARLNGAGDLRLLARQELSALEPQLRAECALLSPETGILSARELMTAYLGDLTAEGGELALRCEVVGVRRADPGFVVSVRSPGEEEFEIQCRELINAAGLGAQALATATRGVSLPVPPLYLCRGCYFALEGPSPFRHLVYPLPERAGLGIHATLDLAGRCRFGPDVEYLAYPDYRVPEDRAHAWYGAIRRYYPGLAEGALVPAYAGIRPKLQAEGGPPEDFAIQGPMNHGVPGLVALYGIESPGLTASLAIGREVRRLLRPA